MRDYYYLWEVLLSLRVEYLNNRKELDELKKYIICDDKRVADFYFWLFKYDTELSVWICSKEKKERLSYLKILLGIYIIGLEETLLERKNNELKLVRNKYNLNLNPNYIDELNKQIDKILASDFVQKMPLYVSDDTKIFQLSLTKLSLATVNEFTFDYYCLGKESIHIENFCEEKRITDEFIWDILNTKIPKTCFNEYHHSIIEKNLNQKEISLLDKNYGKSFANIELKDEKSLVLCKKKRSILSK